MPTDHGRWYRSRPRESHSARRPRRRPPSFPTCPSSALLSILGTIAASSSKVNASPAPPSFLCPSFDQGNIPIAAINTRHPRSLGEVVSYSSDRTDKLAGVARSIPRSIPDRFKQGGDGTWRKVDKYTLYGSTVCPSCEEPSGSVTAVDDEIQDAGSSSIGTSPSSSPSPSYDIRDSLPPGWNRTSNSSASRTALILVLSLVLAFIICFVIISLVFWRKNKRRKHREGDVEMKTRRRRRDIPADEDREVMVQREMKTKQKIWARATARWKANVRYTARQRRSKRFVSTSRMSSHNSSMALDQLGSRASSPVPSPTGPLSRRSSIESLYSDSPVDAVIHSDPASETEEQIQPSLASLPASSHRLSRTSPPAYHQPVTRLQNSKSIEGLSGDTLPSSSSYFLQNDSSEPLSATSDMSLHLPTIHAAHVATDDKSLLARLAGLASSPPPSEASIETPSSTLQVSAPIWRDEEFEDFPCDPGGSPSTPISVSSAPPPLFPPPPSKEKMAAPAFYDYPYSFEDITLEPEAGPSAPPFDDPSGAPPTNNIDLRPSAPPLVDTDYYMEHASAPIHDWGPNDDPPPLHEGAGQEDSHHPAEICMIPPDSRPQADVFVPDMDIHTTRVESPVAADGTLPRYHP